MNMQQPSNTETLTINAMAAAESPWSFSSAVETIDVVTDVALDAETALDAGGIADGAEPSETTPDGDSTLGVDGEGEDPLS
jgi:hypothetical protein